MMARSRLRENQWRDEDVLSEAEYAALNAWTTVTGTHTVVSGGQNLFVDTTGSAFTVTLYDNPAPGQQATFVDTGGYCNTNNTTISGGAEKLNGENQYLYLNEDYASFTLIYGGTNSGWVSVPPPPFMTLDLA
jgi:hypothetical protein